MDARELAHLLTPYVMFEDDPYRARSVFLDAAWGEDPRVVKQALTSAFTFGWGSYLGAAPSVKQGRVFDTAILYYVLAPKAPKGMSAWFFSTGHLDPRQWPASWRERRPVGCNAPDKIIAALRSTFRLFAKDSPPDVALLQAVQATITEELARCLSAHPRYQHTCTVIWARPNDPTSPRHYRCWITDNATHALVSDRVLDDIDYHDVTRQVIDQVTAEMWQEVADNLLGNEGDIVLHDRAAWPLILISSMRDIEDQARRGRIFE